jgi:dimethylaniline monooxygenase (N-oxide forming)
LATGYKISFPFVSQSLIPTDKNEVDLYKYVFSPKLKHPKTLAIISLIQPLGAILPVGELQSRWFALLMANKLKLPTVEKMNENIALKKKFAKRYYESERHTIQVDWIPFMDELATIVGVKPNLWKYFFTDHELWRALVFGPCVPYQYRLEGISSFFNKL